MPFVVSSLIPAFTLRVPSAPWHVSNRRSCCLVDSLDGEHVLQPFLARRFWFLVVADAVGEMFRLNRKLIRMFLRAHLLDSLSADFPVQPDTFVVKRGLHHQIASLAVDCQEAWSALAVRTTTGSDDAGRQLHRPLHRLFHFAETAAALTCGDHTIEIHRLLARDVANRIQRINPQIQQRATPPGSLREPPRARRLLPEEATLQRLQLPELAGLDDRNRLVPHWLIVHAVADHQLDLGLPASVDHL